MKRLGFLIIFLLATLGGAFAQQVLFICSVQQNCPGFPVGTVQAGVDSNGWRNFKLTLTSNVTSFSFIGTPPPSQATATVIFTQDATGGRTVTFAPSISNPCTVTATANATTLCQFEYDGTAGAWIGVSAGSVPAGVLTLGPSFNVAVNYGCKPDGSTDNSTCIKNAFAASNAITSGGVPTVYFPCVPGTGCQYNINAGSGISPFNPLIPTAIKCDPEVTLNFTSGSTAHAMDIGPTTTTTIVQAVGLANKGYSVMYCRFIGGANITEGIFINQFTPKVEIRGNTFFDFGNASSYSIWCQAECWWLNVQTNYEWNDDSVAHNFLRDNNATASIDDESYIANNLNVCVSGAVVVNCGVGYSMAGFFTIYSNDLAGHVPAVRVQAHTNGGHIFQNVIEIDPPGAGNKAAIESNNGGADTQVEVAGNNLFTGATTDSLIGATTGSDVVTLWNVHDNWLRQDVTNAGLVFNLNNLAGQTAKIAARNNLNFSTLINSGSNLTQLISEQLPGSNYYTVQAAGLTLVPNPNNPGVLTYYNTLPVTSAWGTGLNSPGVASVTADYHMAYFNGSTWTDNWIIRSGTGNLESSGVKGLAIGLTSTNAITGPVPVKADTANNNNVVVTTTTDTGAGLVLGICSNSPLAAAGCEVVTTGVQFLTLGTGTCSIGNFVIVDTTTNGRIKCTATYTAGTVIGVALQAQSTVGNTLTVMIGLR